ncbi:hypothetical protein Dimus_028977 [Dionaea muscipula]
MPSTKATGGAVQVSKIPARSPSAQQKRDRPVFTIESAAALGWWRLMEDEKAGNAVDRRFGKFLEACFGCERKISDADEIYMHGFLRAFCTPECRDKHMAQEDKARRGLSDLSISEEFMKLRGANTVKEEKEEKNTIDLKLVEHLLKSNSSRSNQQRRRLAQSSSR